ncbi:diaminopimelate decarboxylase [Rhodobacter sp. SGA-6-6]|uniref:diaminopimelate decarboxylase n=1 Tax=Rhodobacter sp. SGA-6-6 TaxID=2710882 RepID=UPI0013EA02F5|nr:diaminopimelate decarboxylase [Rhodobacter sp. SGA-6-6]NGM47657.1 diaminopimelate decarboxylase [Rhodobacter sp. SGA-6-6]
MTAAKSLARPRIHEDAERWLDREGGKLCAHGVPLEGIASAVGTPFYAYSAPALRARHAALTAAVGPLGVAVCFAVKACSNIHVLAELARLGCGMDIVSGGEMRRALAAGCPAGRIIFSGVGKTRAEIRAALEVGAHQINVESPAELEMVAEVARELGVQAPVALRVNPDVDAHTHAKITTGRKDSKFGIPSDQIPALYADAPPELRMVGLAVHIGSQILDLEPFRQAWSVLADLVRRLRAAGLRVDRLDLGGGLGIGADGGAGPDLAGYAAIIAQTVGGLDLALNVEPGRWLCARAGVMVTEVLYCKPGEDADVVVVDAAMNDLMRPALYDARHPIRTLHPPRLGTGSRPGRLVGPICESSDDFGVYDDLGQIIRGDLLAFGDAGAYGAAMSSTYNSRDLIPEVLIEEGQFRIIRHRAGIRDLLKLEQGGPWQRAG